jgi:hypothetical protein
MGINNIVLSKELVAALYPDSLVVPGSAKRVAQDMLPFLGENRRKIVFAVHCPEVDFLPEDQLAFLGKILTACHCGMADIALVNTARVRLDFEMIHRQLKPVMLFVCGVPEDALILPVMPDLFTMTPCLGTTLLRLPALEQMLRDPDQQAKKKLWVCLQQMFAL